MHTPAPALTEQNAICRMNFAASFLLRTSQPLVGCARLHRFALTLLSVLFQIESGFLRFDVPFRRVLRTVVEHPVSSNQGRPRIQKP